MADLQEYLDLINNTKENIEQDIQDSINTPNPAKASNGIMDYAGDIFLRAPVKSVIKAGTGILSIPTLATDYLANTNYTKKLEEAAEGISPTMHTGFGEVEASIGQFLIPFSILGKVAKGVEVLNSLSTMRKLSTIESTAGKGAELLRRMGYYGSLAGVSDAIATVANTDITPSEAFGLTDKPDINSLEGSERAKAELAEKVKAGLEGGIVGGLAPTVGDVAGAAFKNIVVPAGGAVATITGPVFKTLNAAVVNPIGKIIAGNEFAGVKWPELVPNLISGISNKIEQAKGAIITSLGGDPNVELRLNSINGLFGESLLKRIDNIRRKFITEGQLTPGLKIDQETMEAQIANLQKMVNDHADRIDDVIKSMVSKNENSFALGQDSLDSIRIKQTDINNYLTAPKDQAQKYLNLIDKNIRSDAIALKEILTEVNNTYGKFLLNSGGSAYDEIAQAIIRDKDNFMKERWSSFNNSRYNYDFDSKEGQNVIGYMKTRLLDPQAFRNDLFKQYEKIGGNTEKLNTQLVDYYKKVGTIDKETGGFERNLNFNVNKYINNLPNQFNDFKQLLDDTAMNRLQILKERLIDANKTPQYYFNNIAERFNIKLEKGNLAPGETFDEAIRDFLDKPQFIKDINGNSIEVTNYRGSLLDTILHESKTMKTTQYFDQALKEGLENGLIYESPEAAMDAGRSPAFAKELQDLNKLSGKYKNSIIGNSDLFEKVNGKNGYYATPEYANAVLSANKVSNSLFDLPLYKTLMQAKSAVQITKTLLSPATQARNFGSSGLYLVANGLIGQDVSVKDAWKAIAKDIYGNVSKEGLIDNIGGEAITVGNALDRQNLTNYINDARARSLLSQNIEVNELNYILDQARDGKIDFDNFLRNPVIKKLADIYTGSDNFWKIYADRFYQSALKPAFVDQAVKEYESTTGKSWAKLNQAQQEKEGLKLVTKWYDEVADTPFNPVNTFTGQTKTLNDAIKDISTYLTTNTMPTYSKVPEIIKFLRQFPIGNFVAYPSEIIRTSTNILNIGARELTSSNPFIRTMGAKRLMGMATMMIGIDQGFKSISSYLTGIDQNIMAAYQRAAAPSYQKNSTLIPVTSQDADGNFKYLNFSYTDPYTIIKDPINAVFNAFGDGSLRKETVSQIIGNALFGDQNGRGGAITEFFKPFLNESIAFQAAIDAKNGKTENGKYIWFPQDDYLTITSKSIGNFLDKLEPGAFTSARYIWQGASGEFTSAGTVRDAGTELTKLLTGVRIEDAKPMASMPFILSSYNKDKQNVGTKFATTFYAPNVSLEQRIGAVRDFFAESHDSQSRLYQTIKDLQTLRIDDSDIRKSVAGRFKNADETNSMLNGQFKTPVYSQDRINSLINQLQKENPIMADKISDQFDILKDIFRDLKSEYSKMDLNTSNANFIDQINKLLNPPVQNIRNTPFQTPVNLGNIFNLNTPTQPSPNISPAVVNAGNSSNTLANPVSGAIGQNAGTLQRLKDFFPTGLFSKF